MRVKTLVRKGRLSAALAGRRVARIVDQQTAKTKSPSVKRNLLKVSDLLHAGIRFARPPKRFFPGEAFVSLKELSRYGPESEKIFRDIKKLAFWDKHSAAPMVVGMVGTPIMGALGTCFAYAITKNQIASIAGAIPGVVAGGILLRKSMQSNQREKIEKKLGLLKTVWSEMSGNRPKRLLDSGKYNFLMVDFANDGFRLATLREKDAKYLIALNAKWLLQVKPDERIIVLNAAGEVVYPTVHELGPTQPAPERRVSGAQDRRKGGDKERDRRQAELYETKRFPRA